MIGEGVGLTELCFTANVANSTIELMKSGSPSIANTAYSRDRVTWTLFTPSTSHNVNKITLANIGDKVYFRNDITDDFSSSNHLSFSFEGSLSVSGNCNSIYSSTSFNSISVLSYKFCYFHLFSNAGSSIGITSAPALPATTLSDSCYHTMFSQCQYLIDPPELPATTLASNCYHTMFSNCKSLTTAPQLPATTLATACYSGMFMSCTSLATVPALPATTLVDSCYYCMFYDCTSLYVSDEPEPLAQNLWKIPSSGTFTNTKTYNQTYMFTNCLGTRSSDNMSGALGGKHTYCTQNQPV